MSTGFAVGQMVAWTGGRTVEIVALSELRAIVRIYGGPGHGVRLDVALADLEQLSELRIGAYTLRRLSEGIWLAHDHGEAMQTTEAKLEAALARFWKEEF